MDGSPAPLGHQPQHDELVFAEGQTVDAVARRLDVSERTVRRRARAACGALGVDTTVEAIVWAVRHRLI